ncbi:MAG: hypothetical protein ABI434_22165 [Burkholderiaceae bacterium]
MIENIYSDGKAERVTVIAAEIVRSNVDLIITAGTPGSLAVKAATTTIPIVFFFGGFNLKTARAIGVTIPQNVLLRADEVIQ